MTIRHLKVFHTVCKHMSMTEAAKEMFLTQSAVSQTVKELEEHYHTVLFERFPRRLELTEAGRVLNEIATGILLSYNEIDTLLANAGQEGVLRIGANLSVGTVLIHDYLSRFEALYPQVKVELLVTRGSVLISQLVENQLDLLLMEHPGRESELISKPFYKDRIIFVGSSNEPLAAKKHVTLREVCRQPLLIRERGAGVRNQFDHLVQAQGVTVHPAWESSSTTSLVQAVLHGRGIAVVPYLLVKDYLDRGDLKEIPVEDVSLGRVLYTVYHKKKHITPALQAFIDIVLGDGFMA